MKTISIRQPWGHLICTPRENNPCLGIKDIENRTWPTKFRGRVLVHAAAKSWLWHKVLQYLSPALKEFATKNKWTRTWLENLQTGAIIGSVEIVDCVINHESVWAEKSELIIDENKVCHTKTIHNWVLANPVLFSKPILNVKGKLSFWDYPITEEEYLKLI